MVSIVGQLVAVVVATPVGSSIAVPAVVAATPVGALVVALAVAAVTPNASPALVYVFGT